MRKGSWPRINTNKHKWFRVLSVFICVHLWLVLGLLAWNGGAAVAVGDYDNDGFDDMFVTDSDNGRKNHLYHNNHDLTFTEVTDSAGVAGGNDPLSIVADALWFDYDNDGWVDLLVARFGTPILYHNEHEGKFKDVTASAGLN